MFQSSVGAQRLEELAIKQSRQLIPMMPLMPKTLVRLLLSFVCISVTQFLLFDIFSLSFCCFSLQHLPVFTCYLKFEDMSGDSCH